MSPEGWAQLAAALPERSRAERELPFWRSVVERWAVRRALDAGCGAGFHVRLLRALGVDAVGIDLALSALATGSSRGVVSADVVRPPIRPASRELTVCLGNTLSLIDSRAGQRATLTALLETLAPGGLLIVQGEDVSALVAGGPMIRSRQLAGGGMHERVFWRAGRRVVMGAAAVDSDGDRTLAETVLTPTSARAVRRLVPGRLARPTALPLAAPTATPDTWWLAFERR